MMQCKIKANMQKAKRRPPSEALQPLMDRLLIAPCTSPNSSAFVVPMACARSSYRKPDGNRVFDFKQFAHALRNDIAQHPCHNDDRYGNGFNTAQLAGHAYPDRSCDGFWKQCYIPPDAKGQKDKIKPAHFQGCSVRPPVCLKQSPSYSFLKDPAVGKAVSPNKLLQGSADKRCIFRPGCSFHNRC